MCKLLSTQYRLLSLAVVVVALLVLVPVVSNAATKEDAEAICSAADTARKQAADVGMEWRDTGKLIKSANKALESGDYAAAVKQCEKAKREGETGVKQAEIEKSSWASRVPK
jgi:hypothetical protein